MTDDDLILTPDKKKLIIDQVTSITSRLESAIENIENHDFNDAINDIKSAMEISTCSACKEKMEDIAGNAARAAQICMLNDGGKCKRITEDVVDGTTDFIENYLPSAEAVLQIKEEK